MKAPLSQLGRFLPGLFFIHASFAWATLATEASGATGGTTGTHALLTPIPEIGALFPIIGLIVAIAATQILRRRRLAQQRSSSSSGR